jgi:predicted small secreted protein
MQRLGNCSMLLSLALAFTGCSQATQQETGKALEHTGKALQRAAEDAGNIVEGAVKRVAEGAEKNRMEPDRQK